MGLFRGSFQHRVKRRASGAPKPGEEELILAGKEMTEQLALTMTETFRFYTKTLAPDGRELSAEERAAVKERLDAGVLALRAARVNRDFIAYILAEEDFDVRSTISVLRMMQRSLVLALSADPDRRARAISPAVLVSFIRPVYEFWACKWGLPDWEENVKRYEQT